MKEITLGWSILETSLVQWLTETDRVPRAPDFSYLRSDSRSNRSLTHGINRSELKEITRCEISRDHTVRAVRDSLVCVCIEEMHCISTTPDSGRLDGVSGSHHLTTREGGGEERAREAGREGGREGRNAG